ncbi:MAG: ABC transporter permease [Bacteroidota bacterium]
MHPRIIWALVRKDLLDVWLNKSAVVGLIYPIIMSLLFLLISRLVGSSTTDMLIYDPGSSGLAEVVAHAFPNARVTRAGSAAEVEAAFGPNGARKKIPYEVGLVLPQGLDAGLRAGARPALSLYLNGSSVKKQAQAMLQTAIVSYARTVASPAPPVIVNPVVINPPSTEDAGVILGQIYTPIVLLLSLTVGTSFIPMLLIEEKEKKTLRMLLVTPASFRDILIAKLLVVLLFQLAITSIVLAIQGGFSGQVALVVLYMILGACFSLSLGLFFGSVFNTTGAAGTVAGLVSMIYIIGGIFVGELGQILASGPVLGIARLLPTYYLAEGVLNASQNLEDWGSHVLDITVILGSTLVLLGMAAWALRRQSAKLATI